MDKMIGVTKLNASKDTQLTLVLSNVYSKEECEAWIERLKKTGNFTPAMIQGEYGEQVLDTELRKHQRWMEDDESWTADLWGRIGGIVAEEFKSFAPDKAVGLNERMRYLKYEEGEYFKPHFDLSFRKENGQFSLLTVMVYLNDDYKGGETIFLDEEDEEFKVTYKPIQGQVLVFEHDIYHEGSILISGTKYAARTDVMFDDTR